MSIVILHGDVPLLSFNEEVLSRVVCMLLVSGVCQCDGAITHGWAALGRHVFC